MFRPTESSIGVLAALACTLPFAVFGSTEPAKPAATSSVQPIPVEAVVSQAAISEYRPIAISPDNRAVALVIRTPRPVAAHDEDSSEAKQRSGVPWSAVNGDIYLSELTTGSTRNLTKGAGDNWSPTWAPNARTVAFLSNRAQGKAPKVARLWTLDVASGAARRVSQLDVRGLIAWSPDSKRVLVQLFPVGVTAEQEAAALDAVEPDSKRADVAVAPGAKVTLYTFAPKKDESTKAESSGAGWSIGRQRRDLAWIDVATGRTERVVTNAVISTVRLAPDGRTIAYSTPKGFEQSGSQQIIYDIVTVGATGSRVVASDVRLNYNGAQFNWSPARDRIAFRTSGMLASRDVFVVTLDGQAPRNISGTRHEAFTFFDDAPLWDRAGTQLFFTDRGTIWRAPVDGTEAIAIAKIDGHTADLMVCAQVTACSSDGGRTITVRTVDTKNSASGFSAVDVTGGAVTPILEELKHFGGYSAGSNIMASDDGTVAVYGAEDAAHSPDIYTLQLRAGAVPKRLTVLNPSLDRYVMGEARIVDWRSADGDAVSGVLLLPAGYTSEKRYPLITKVYGGATPTKQLRTMFGLQAPSIDNLQLLATRGYAVLLPDLQIRLGTMMSDLAKQVVPGVDRLIDMGIADPVRLGVTGHSFGGYNTIALITQTTRFRAAMMAAGGANLTSAYGFLNKDGTNYGIAVLEHGQFELQGTPWEQRARYLDNSAILYLDRVKTPLLIVHGGADEAVPAYLAGEIFVGLRRLGQEVTYARYEGEDHHMQSWTRANQLDYWNRQIDWWERHLKGDVAPAAPVRE